MTDRISGVRGEFLWELDIAEKQHLAMAEAVPAGKYGWRPHPKARSFGEVVMHVAAGNFMLLDALGTPAPSDLYRGIPAGGEERLWAMVRLDDERMKNPPAKDEVVAHLKRSLQALRQALTQATDADLERRMHFFGEDTTVRRVYLRLLAHAHEHMGQLIAYLRMNDIAIPWSDWRPDRK